MGRNKQEMEAQGRVKPSPPPSAAACGNRELLIKMVTAQRVAVWRTPGMGTLKLS